MELESLKYIWRSLETPQSAKPDRQTLLALLQKKSRRPVARMRRNLVREAIILLVTYIPGIACYLVEFDGRLAAISWIFIIVAVFFGAYYFRKYRLLKEMECISCKVRSNLARQVATLEKYTRFYLLSGTALIPFTFALSYGIIRWKLPSPGNALYRSLHPEPWWA